MTKLTRGRCEDSVRRLWRLLSACAPRLGSRVACESFERSRRTVDRRHTQSARRSGSHAMHRVLPSVRRAGLGARGEGRQVNNIGERVPRGFQGERRVEPAYMEEERSGNAQGFKKRCSQLRSVMIAACSGRESARRTAPRQATGRPSAEFGLRQEASLPRARDELLRRQRIGGLPRWVIRSCSAASSWAAERSAIPDGPRRAESSISSVGPATPRHATRLEAVTAGSPPTRPSRARRRLPQFFIAAPHHGGNSTMTVTPPPPHPGALVRAKDARDDVHPHTRSHINATARPTRSSSRASESRRRARVTGAASSINVRAGELVGEGSPGRPRWRRRVRRRQSHAFTARCASCARVLGVVWCANSSTS